MERGDRSRKRKVSEICLLVCFNCCSFVSLFVKRGGGIEGG